LAKKLRRSYNRRVARKYRNQPITLDGISFPSKKEAARWIELRLLQKAGLISELRRQVKYDLAVNGVKICAYWADFVYISDGLVVVEDVKSEATKTPVFKLKSKLMKALMGIDVRCV
jgi:hypothetical protein